MTKLYDARYFARWYRRPGLGDKARPVRTAAAAVATADYPLPAPMRRLPGVRCGARLVRKVAVAVATAEYHLQRPIRSVLDIGCGEGVWRAPLLKLRPKLNYLGFDSSEYAIRRYGRSRQLHFARFGDFAELRPCAPA